MTDLDELPFAAPDSQPNLGAAPPRKCRHTVWERIVATDASGEPTILPKPGPWRCANCGKLKDEAAVRRGRSSLRAGKDAERAIAKAYPGGRRTGQYGGPDDVVVGDLFVVQSKAGAAWFAERYWNELAKLPRTGGRIPTLVVSDRPGPGHKTRRLVIRLMSDDVDLHGVSAPQEPTQETPA
jgi:hypothetical protein